MTREQKNQENFAKVEEAIERANKSSLNNQRYVLSPEKIKQLSLNDLVHTVERLAHQRMEVHSFFPRLSSLFGPVRWGWKPAVKRERRFEQQAEFEQKCQ